MFETLRQRLIGALILFALGGAVAATVSGRVGRSSIFVNIARMFDSLAPQLLLGILCICLVLALLGARRVAAVLALAVLVFGTWFAAQHVTRSLPLLRRAEPELKVLWFNTLSTNTANAERIVDAAEASGADVVAFAEAKSLTAEIARLQADYPYFYGCERGCELVVLSRVPVEVIPGLQNAPFMESRRKLLQFLPPGGAPVNILFIHKYKPWAGGPADVEDQLLAHQIAAVKGPLVVIGDCNAAPWSYPLRRMMEATGLKAPRLPVPTWPVGSGWFGVPIDNVFVRGGARLTALAPFGHDLGSNHLGLLADVTVE